jgi:hypothetical protein
LASWGYQLRNRGRAPWSPLHFATSAWILLLSVRYIWIQWGWRDIEWTYVDYVMAVGPALALALAAHVAKIDVGTPRSHPIYEQCRRPVCLLLAARVVLAPARGIVSTVPDPAVIGPQAGVLVPTFAVMLGTLAWLGLSRTTTRHGVGWALGSALNLNLHFPPARSPIESENCCFPDGARGALPHARALSPSSRSGRGR